MNYEDFPSLSSSKHLNSAEEVYIPDYIPLTSESLNLESELLEQYNRARKLLHDASYDSNAPLNQKAQVINSTTSILAALIKSQAELYSLERVKRIEAALLSTLKAFPEMQEMFLAAYMPMLVD